MFDRQAAQLLIEKLDQKAITPTEAKRWAKLNYNVTLKGRTRDDVARSAGMNIENR